MNNQNNPFLKAIEKMSQVKNVVSVAQDGDGFSRNTKILNATMTMKTDKAGLLSRLVSSSAEDRQNFVEGFSGGPAFYIKGHNVSASEMLKMFPSGFQIKPEGTKTEGMVEIVVEQIEKVSYLGAFNHRRMVARRNKAGSIAFKQPSDAEMVEMYGGNVKDRVDCANAFTKWRNDNPVFATINARKDTVIAFEESKEGRFLIGSSKKEVSDASETSDGVTSVFLFPLFQTVKPNEMPYVLKCDFMRTSAMTLSEMSGLSLAVAVENRLKSIMDKFSIAYGNFDIFPYVMSKDSQQYAVPVLKFNGQPIKGKGSVESIIVNATDSSGTFPKISVSAFAENLCKNPSNVAFVEEIKGVNENDLYQYLTDVSNDVRFWAVKNVVSQELREAILNEIKPAKTKEEILARLSQRRNAQLAAPQGEEIPFEIPSPQKEGGIESKTRDYFDSNGKHHIDFRTVLKAGIESKIIDCFDSNGFKPEIVAILNQKNMSQAEQQKLLDRFKAASENVKSMRLAAWFEMME